GIGMVFQDFVQVPAMSVAENLALFLPDLPWRLDRTALAQRIDATSERYGIDVNLSASIRQLSVGERQKVEVLKLLLADARLLIRDEPTRSLAPHEVQALFRTFDMLRRDGYALIFIAHKLSEVLACADRITVMRRGRVAGTLARADATEDALVALMFGPEPFPSSVPRRAGRSGGQPILALDRVGTHGEPNAMRLRDIDLTIQSGEIVGVAGVSGNGQRELGDVILGLQPCAEGVKRLAGRDATRWSVARIRASGVAFIPEDALGMAAVPAMTAVENMALGDTRRYARAGGLDIDWSAARAELGQALDGLRVSLPSLDVPVGSFSGGNVQRMVVAREMAHRPRLIVAFYPTRGLDARSAVAARELLVGARDDGAGVLLISEDLDELRALSDRLVVLFHGRIVRTVSPSDTTLEEIGFLMTRGAA